MKNKFSFLKCVRFDSHLQKKKKKLLGVLTRWLRTNIMEPIVSNTVVCLCLYIYI